LKTVFLDDTLDAPGTDRETCLPELLRNDIDRRVGIEEAVANDLAFDLIGEDGFGLGAAFLRLESLGPVVLENLEHLIITLSGKSVFFGGLSGTKPFAFSFDEHEQAGRDYVVVWNDQIPVGSVDVALGELEFHDRTSLVDERLIGERGPE
jgi:hypothetical protein